MNIFRNRIRISQLIAFAIVIGGIGGVISGEWPKSGAAMTILGVIGALWDHFSAESHSNSVDTFLEVQAILLAKNGIGNIYTEAGKLELHKGIPKRAKEQFRKALGLNPNDQEALISLGVMLALELASEQWLKAKKGTRFQAKIGAAKECARRGKLINPREHCFHDILGIIYDVEGNHEDARDEFRISGTLRSDPYWHLLLATSWSMSDHDKEAVAEIERAINKGADNWLVDFYYGRALCKVGDYDKALPLLEKALKLRKFHVQVLSEIAETHYFQGHFAEAAKYQALCSFVMLTQFPMFSVRRFGWAVHHMLLHMITGLSRRLWPMTKRIPILNWLHLRFCSPGQPNESLGLKLIRCGHYRFAEKHLKMAVCVLPNSPYLLANLSTCLSIQGKQSEAIEMCDKAIKFAKVEPLLSQLRHQRLSVASDRPKRIVKMDRDF